MNKSILYVLFFYTIVSFSQSNTLFQKTYTTQDGLEIDHITALCFDDDAFLWLGGSNLDNRAIVASTKKMALQRFDGNTFHSISLPEYDNSIKKIHQIYKRKDGKLYVVCKLTKGFTLLLLDPVTTEFEQVNFKGFGLLSEGMSNIFSYENKDYLLLQKDRTISLRLLNSDLSSKELFSFTSTENRFLMEDYSRILPFKDFVMISDDNFTVKVFDWNGNLIKLIDTVDTHTSPPQKRIVIDEVFVKDNTQYVFLQNNPNLYKIDELKKDIIRVKNNELPNIHLNTYTDAFGNTRIIASNKERISFNSFKDNLLTTDYQLNMNVNYGIKVASKNIRKDFWLATSGELHYFKFPSTTVKNFLPNYQFRTIKPLDTEHILATTERNGWFKINTNTHEVTPYKITLNNTTFKGGSRNIMLEDSILWTNGNYGIIEVNTKTRIAKSYRHYPIICLEKLNDSVIVYGTKGYNLMQFNTKTKAHTPLVDYHKDYGYLLGSRSGTIVAFNPTNESFTTIYKDELKAGIATILFDDNLWWINTFNGVVAFNTEDKTTTRFSEKDGFSHFEGNRYSALKTEKGLFFGMIKGLNYFNPKELKAQNDFAKLTLLKVRHYNETDKVFKDEFNRNTFTNNYNISLPSENRALDIDFGLKNINAVNKGYSFRYRLNDKDWVELKGKSSIQFPNLAAGNYILEIEAEDFSGNKIGESLLVNIKSKAFFYKTWWFFLLVSLAAISILLWMLNQTNSKRRLQEQFALDLIQSQEDERKRIASELHDSVSQQLTLIKRKAQSQSQLEISELTNNTLEEVRHISRGLFPPLLKQLGFTESVAQLALDIDENNDIFVTTDIENIDDHLTNEKALHLYRFIQECINNILKHAEAKAFSITIEKEKDGILVQVKDNGKGFNLATAKSKNSLGLKTLEERIKIINGELFIDSKLGKGTITKAKIHV